MKKQYNVVDEKGCADCQYAKLSKFGRVTCTFPMCKTIPANVHVFDPHVGIDREYIVDADHSSDVTVVFIRTHYCHIEYYDEGTFKNCPCWKKREKEFTKRKWETMNLYSHRHDD